MFTFSSATLAHASLAILTMSLGLLAGWLAKGTTRPPASPAPSSPTEPTVTDPTDLNGVFSSILANLQSPGQGLGFPTLSHDVSRQQLFHLIASVILQIPLPAASKAKALQDLVGFLDGMFNPLPPAPMPAKQ